MNTVLFIVVVSVIVLLWIVDRVLLMRKLNKVSQRLALLKTNEQKLLEVETTVNNSQQQAHALVLEAESLAAAMIDKANKDVEAAKAEAKLIKQNAKAYLEVIKKKADISADKN